jgi:hypothetical protein
MDFGILWNSFKRISCSESNDLLSRYSLVIACHKVRFMFVGQRVPLVVRLEHILLQRISKCSNQEAIGNLAYNSRQ